MDSTGTFRFGGAANNFIDFNGTQLVIDTPELSVDGYGNATFSGTLDASSISTGTLDVARLANIGSAQIADGTIINAKIGNAQITTAKIDDAQVDTLQIAGQAVTFPRGVSASDNISVVGNVLSIAITATGAPLIITGSVNITDASISAYGQGGRVEASLYRGGTKIFGPVSVATSVPFNLGPGGVAYRVVGGGSIQAYMPSGVSGTYYLKLSVIGVSTDPRVESRSLTIMEAKR